MLLCRCGRVPADSPDHGLKGTAGILTLPKPEFRAPVVTSVQLLFTLERLRKGQKLDSNVQALAVTLLKFIQRMQPAKPFRAPEHPQAYWVPHFLARYSPRENAALVQARGRHGSSTDCGQAGGRKVVDQSTPVEPIPAWPQITSAS